MIFTHTHIYIYINSFIKNGILYGLLSLFVPCVSFVLLAHLIISDKNGIQSTVYFHCTVCSFVLLAHLTISDKNSILFGLLSFFVPFVVSFYWLILLFLTHVHVFFFLNISRNLLCFTLSSPRGAGYIFGADPTQNFLDFNNATLIARAH